MSARRRPPTRGAARGPGWRAARGGVGLGVAAAVSLLAAGPAAVAAPRCLATVSVDPPHGFVGQQRVYSVAILRRQDVVELDWDRALSFPAFRSEWLPGISDDAPVARDGARYLRYRERRALFPARSGLLQVPPAVLRCRSADGEDTATVPGLAVTVEALPRAGRPSGFRGLVGPVDLTAHLSAPRVVLGGSVQLAVTIRGEHNLWDVRLDPSASPELAGVEVFARPAELARDAGRRLGLRRHLRFELVPRAPGSLPLPALRVAYFDPRRREYAEAVLAAPTLEVEPAPTPPPQPPAEPGPAAKRRPATWPAALLLAVLFGGLAFAGWRRRRTGVEGAEAAARLAEAERAEARGDADHTARALAAALRTALAERVAGAAALSAEELCQRTARDPRLAAVAERLREADAARFDPEAAPPSVEAARRALRALRPPDPARRQGARSGDARATKA